MASRAIRAYELVLTDSPLLLLPSEGSDQQHPEVSIAASWLVLSTSHDVGVPVCTRSSQGSKISISSLIAYDSLEWYLVEK